MIANVSSMDPKTVERIKSMVGAAEARMRLALLEARAKFEHSGNKGIAVEEAVRALLRRFLPKNFSVGHGELIDSSGRRSKQTDVVVINHDHPPIYAEMEPDLFFVEGVSAAGEVKSVLTTEALQGAAESAHIFKQLRSNPGHGAITHSNPADIRRFGSCPPYFVLAIESQIDADRIAEVMRAISADNPEFKNNTFDALLVLDRGLWTNLYDGMGSYTFIGSDGSRGNGWIMTRNDHQLFDFISWLTIVMPRIIRFQPILPMYTMAHGSFESLREQFGVSGP